MKSYIRQIDSLNTLNKKLINENVTYRKEISSAKLRAEMAEEKAAELDNKVRVGAVIRAATSVSRRSTPTANPYRGSRMPRACAWISY